MMSCSVTNTMAKPQNWATFDPGAAGKKLGAAVCGTNYYQCNFNGHTKNWATLYPCATVLEMLAPRIGNFFN